MFIPSPHSVPTVSLNEPLPIGCELNNNFVIECKLGTGGFGITYLAWEKLTRRTVVIKENFPQDCACRSQSDGNEVKVLKGKESIYKWSQTSFVKEAVTLSQLPSHPHIAQVLTLFAENNTSYLVMKQVEGQTLEQHYPPNKNISADALQSFLLTVLETLEFLHKHGVAHRDLKPSNVMLTSDGSPVLIDFGAARALGNSHSATQIGTYGYAPPEQMASSGYDKYPKPLIDVYALGATCYRLITGDEPSYVFEALAQSPELCRRYPKNLLESIDKARQLKPDDRWQSACDWLSAIAPAKADDSKRKVSVPVWVFVSMLLPALLACYWLFQQKTEAEQRLSDITGGSENQSLLATVEQLNGEVNREKSAREKVQSRLDSQTAALAEAKRQLEQEKTAHADTQLALSNEKSELAEVQSRLEQEQAALSASQTSLAVAQRKQEAEQASRVAIQEELVKYRKSIATGTFTAEQARATLTTMGISATEYSDKLYEAAGDGDEKLLRLLVAAGADVNSTGGDYHWPALTVAAARGHEDCVKVLLAAPGIEVNKKEQSEVKGTAFYWAVREKQYACQWLLQGHKDVNINMPDAKSFYPLHVAVMNNDPASLSLLLRHSAVRVSVTDADGKTPLARAKSKGYKVCESLLNQQ